MTVTPRLALATDPHGSDPAPASLAVLAGLSAAGWRVQHFRSWASPISNRVVGTLTGRPGRHLDAWLMPPAVCRRVFEQGARGADLAIVEGTLDRDPVADQGPTPGQRVPIVAPASVGLYGDRPGPLAPLAEALDLPRVLVLDSRLLTQARPHLPWIPDGVDAVLLDHLERPRDFEGLRSLVGLLLKKPVVGAIEALPVARAALAALRPDQAADPEAFRPLAESFVRFADLPAWRALAESRPLPHGTDLAADADPDDQTAPGRPFRVAYAMDEVFGGYYPDTLAAIEALGGELLEFSPLRDDSLPRGVDLVLIGCGFSDLFAEELAANVCLIADLRAHVCRGRRIYAEGGGAAYLGRSLIVGDRVTPGAGILCFDATLHAQPTPPVPVERTLVRDAWLGPAGSSVRGYHSGRWSLAPAPEPGDCPSRSGRLTAEADVYFRNNAVGSLIHLHLGALPKVVAAFAGRGPELRSSIS